MQRLKSKASLAKFTSVKRDEWEMGEKKQGDGCLQHDS